MLPRGSILPMPRNIGSLDGVPNGFASLEALAGSERTLVLLASSDSYLSERLRSTLVAFQGRLPTTQIGASMAAVCKAPTSNLRKLARKAKVGMPLLSDPDGEWTTKLNCQSSGEVNVFLIDVSTTKVFASYTGAGIAPETFVQTVTEGVKRRDELLTAGTPSAPAVVEEEVPEGDDLPEEWAFAAAPAAPAPVKAPPPPPPPPPTIAIPKPQVTYRAPAAPPPPSKSDLEAENEKLRAALRAAKAEEAARAMRAENEQLRAQLEAAEAAARASKGCGGGT